MIIQRVPIQNTTVVLPSIFTTSTELTSMVRANIDSDFYIIKPETFTPCLTIERQTSKVVVNTTPIGRSKKVFDTKVTQSRVKKLPADYIFHLNLNGLVLGVRDKNDKALPLAVARQIVSRTKLTMVPLVHLGTKIAFVNLFLKCLLDEESIPWEGTKRTGFYIGDNPLRHASKTTLPGVVAIAIPSEHAVRIKGIFKHAPDYAETVFWFELKQCAPTTYEILKEQELSSRFMENLDRCL